MDQSTMGTQVLMESDIIDILKQHFWRYNQGFKQIRFNVDQIVRDSPRFSIEILLEKLNKKKAVSRVEELYNELLESCKEVTQVEDAIIGKIYELSRLGKITKETFIELIKKI